MHWNIKKNKFPFTIGMELTGLYRHYKNCKSSEEDCAPETTSMNKVVSAMVYYRLRKQYPHLEKAFQNSSFQDSGGVEIPSPVCRTVSDLKRFYHKLWEVFGEFGYVPQQRDITVCAGNHTHVGMKDTLSKIAVARTMAAGYFIPWVFAHPDDTVSCSNMCNSWQFATVVERLKTHPNRPGYGFEHTYHLLCAPNPATLTISEQTWNHHRHKCSSFSHTGKTFECRAFEAPINWKELTLQLTFIVRLVQYAKAQAKQGKFATVEYMNNTALQSITANKAYADFVQLLHTLELDERDYDVFVKRNLYPRWELGRQRV